MQTLQGVLFLVAYLAAVLGNGLIITLNTWDPQLHTPMYFFLKNLSLIDLCYISVTVPKFVLNSLLNRNTISFLACVFQVLFFAGFGAVELGILTVMSYDRYVAICCPLHYDSIMTKGACGRMVVASYISMGIYGAMHTAATFSTTFTSNKIYHFFCDIPQIILISDSKMNINEASVTAFGACISLACFFSILYSYVHISAVSRISSLEGSSKALSTCLPHLVVVTLFYSTGAVAYLKPASEGRSDLDTTLSVCYTVVPPSLNPTIYSLRNKDIKFTLGKFLGFLAWVTEFFLLEFFDDLKIQTIQGVLFLMAYLAALLGNGFIIMLITWDPQLHTPMYFFLKKLSLIDLCYISVTIHKFALNSLMSRNKISFLRCIFQVLFFVTFAAAAEFAILTVMSYNRYVALCLPLHYETIMIKGACGQMVVASYVSAGIYGAMHSAATFSTTFSSNKIHHFFCDIPQIILISD
ncbi:Olfactory Receptor 14A16 [Manis pentadactyla]|nr:Olfactory Receptor 14A16 [Manis pentadactyla]